MKHLEMILSLLAVVGCAGILFSTVLVTQNSELREENLRLQERLNERQVCPDVMVTCDCPEYEEGYEDAEWVQGCDNLEIPWEELQDLCVGVNGCDKPQAACDPSEMSQKDLEIICAEWSTYGYIPGC